MGKGTIVSHLGSGLYSVTLNRDRSRIITYLAWIDTRLAEIVLALVDYEASEIAAKAAYDDSIVAMNTLIQDLQDHPDQYATLEPQIVAATEDSLAKQATWQGWIYALRSTRLEQASLEKRKAVLESADLSDPVVVAWCADLTTNLSGVVATAEVPGERGTVQIRPGYGTGEVHSMTRDGQLQPIQGGTAASAYWNCALLPGWQKWKPTYRYGTITAKSGNTCSVALDAAVSSAQGISINQAAVLTNVPIEYMECNGSAFTVGDAVLIQFTGQDWSAPKVIGFKDNPRSCPLGIYSVQFEKNWFATWLADHGGSRSADDMFIRCYLKVDAITGEPTWITPAEAEEMCSIKDTWSEILWRAWYPQPGETAQIPFDSGTCRYRYIVAKGRNFLFPSLQYVFRLGSVKVAIASTDYAMATWSVLSSGFILLPNAIPQAQSPIPYYPYVSWHVKGYFPRGDQLPHLCAQASYSKDWGAGDDEDPLDITGAWCEARVTYLEEGTGDEYSMQAGSWKCEAALRRLFPDWPYYTYGPGETSMFTLFYGTEEEWFGEYYNPPTFGWGIFGRGWAGWVSKTYETLHPAEYYIQDGFTLSRWDTGEEDTWPEDWEKPLESENSILVHFKHDYKNSFVESEWIRVSDTEQFFASYTCSPGQDVALPAGNVFVDNDTDVYRTSSDPPPSDSRNFGFAYQSVMGCPTLRTNWRNGAAIDPGLPVGSPYFRVELQGSTYTIYAKVWDLAPHGRSSESPIPDPSPVLYRMVVQMSTSGNITSATLDSGAIPTEPGANVIYDTGLMIGADLLLSDLAAWTLEPWHQSAAWTALWNGKRDEVAPGGTLNGICRLLEK